MLLVSTGACWAQGAAGYPAKTIRMIIALAPGGGVDTAGRLVGQKPVGSPPDEFAAYVKTETAKWGKLVREAGIQAN